jgi:hypothetical protein
MSNKILEVEQVLQGLRAAAKAINQAADSLCRLYADNTIIDHEAEIPPEPPKPKALKLEDVRLVLAELSRNGHTEAVRQLLEKFGASKLSAVDPAKYADLLAEAEGIGNG